MWIVLWLVVSTMPVECPDFKPDPYTGEYPNSHCAVYHCKTVTEVKTKEFTTSEEAAEFIKAAPEKVKAKMKLVQLDALEDNTTF